MSEALAQIAGLAAVFTAAMAWTLWRLSRDPKPTPQPHPNPYPWPGPPVHTPGRTTATLPGRRR